MCSQRKNYFFLKYGENMLESERWPIVWNHAILLAIITFKQVFCGYLHDKKVKSLVESVKSIFIDVPQFFGC